MTIEILNLKKLDNTDFNLTAALVDRDTIGSVCLTIQLFVHTSLSVFLYYITYLSAAITLINVNWTNLLEKLQAFLQLFHFYVHFYHRILIFHNT